MPYSIRKAGDKYKLIKKDTGEEVSTHDSRKSAMDQIKAIYANEGKDASKKDSGEKWLDDGMGAYNSLPMSPMPVFSADDPRVNYDPLGGNKTYACANCEFFEAARNGCQLVIGDVVATGYCDLWQRELTKDERMADRAMPVYMVEKSFLAKVKETVQEVLGLKSSSVDIGTGFKTFGPDNRYWVAFWSNNARDRDGEWFAERAHDRYIARVDSGQIPMPELWYWHEPIRSGKALWVDRVGHIVMAVGEFFDNPTGQSMKEFFSNTKVAHKLSHGFLYPRSQYVDGVYNDYTTFEISPLPADVAANPFTAFGSVEEIGIPMDEQKKQRLVALLGAERAKAVLGEAELKSKELDELRLEFKGATSDPMDLRMKAIETRFDSLLEILTERLPANKAKKVGKEGSAEEEDTESDTEAEAEGDKPKGKKKEAATPSTIPPELITALNKMSDAVVAQGKAIKAIESQFANPVPASRSQYTQVPPGDPALATIIDKMTKAANPGQVDTPPVPGQQYPPENIASFNTVFGGTPLAPFAPPPNGHQ